MIAHAPTSGPGFFRRHRLAILAGVGALLPLIYFGSVRALRSNRNDVKSWLPAAYEETATFNWYTKHFGSDAFILASWEGCALGSPELARFAARLRTQIQAPGEAGGSFFREVTTGQELLEGLVGDQGLSRRVALARLRGSVIGPDGRQTCLLLTICPAAMEKWETMVSRGGQTKRGFFHAALEQVYETAESCGITRDRLHLGGPPVDNVAIDVEGERSLIKLATACGILGLVLSWWSLRSWKLTVIVFTTALFSAGLSLALVSYSGTTMNAVLLTMPTLVFVTATSGAIHLANYYREAAAQSGVAGAADQALAHTWIPLGLATGTTGIGLLSLGVSELSPIRLFGVYSAAGVLMAFGMLCTYMPSLLDLWSPVTRRKREAPTEQAAGAATRRQPAGSWIVRHHWWVNGGCLIVMAVGGYGATRVVTSVKLMRLFSPQARIIQDYAWLEEHLGPLVPMEIVVRVDQQRCQLGLLEQLRLVRQVQRAVERMDEVGSALAAPTFAPSIPNRVGVLQRAVWNSVLARHRTQLADYWSREGDEQLWRISARVGALNDLDYEGFVGDLRKSVEPVLQSYQEGGVDGVSATYTGLVPLIYKAQHSLLNGLMLGFVGDLLLIAVAIVVLMRNWSAGPLLMLPSVFPLAIVFGGMGLLGIVVDTGTVMTPAVALGVTVDDAIHFMLWCRRGQQLGMDRTESIMFAYRDCARAIYQSWAVIGLGLSAFALSSFTPTRRFGILMFTMLTVSSVGNLVFLPALLAGPAGRWFWLASKRVPQSQSAGRHRPQAVPAKWPCPMEPPRAEHVAQTKVEKVSVSGARAVADDLPSFPSATGPSYT
jgi:predicted RND superfamily exporter protein